MLEIQSPPTGYSAPLDAFLLFVCKEKPNPTDFDIFDDFTEDQVNSYIPASINTKKARISFILLASSAFLFFLPPSSNLLFLILLPFVRT